ncbi:MAG: GAF domain-containing protein [Flavobacteriales bacterium]|nr:GAF domain-containing protein [Flavobacteriales bacterium]
MNKPPIPVNEIERLDSIERLAIMDTSPEQEYDDIVQLASLLAGTPISLISLVDADRQWFKAKVGVDESETDRDIAFCAHAILSSGPMIIENLMEDRRFVDNPLVLNDPNVRFYAGFPLITSEGHALGTLCVLDREPRALIETQIFGLKTLADQVLRNFELRRSAIEIRKNAELIGKQRDVLLRSSKIQKNSWARFKKTFKNHCPD